MTNLLTWNFWLTLRPETFTSSSQRIFIGFLILLAAAAILIALVKRNVGIYRGFLNRLYGFCLGNAVIGAILFFFNYEMVPFFAARFWIALWVIIMIVWFILIFKNLKKIPLAKKTLEAEKELKKYLP